jgi:hypothetical protein
MTRVLVVASVVHVASVCRTRWDGMATLGVIRLGLIHEGGEVTVAG